MVAGAASAAAKGLAAVALTTTTTASVPCSWDFRVIWFHHIDSCSQPVPEWLCLLESGGQLVLRQSGFMTIVDEGVVQGAGFSENKRGA